MASSVAPVVENLPANARDIRDMGSIPGSGSSPGVGNGNLLQYVCLENPMDRGVWWTTVHRVPKSPTRLKQHSTHTHKWQSIHSFFQAETISGQLAGCWLESSNKMYILSLSFFLYRFMVFWVSSHTSSPTHLIIKVKGLRFLSPVPQNLNF